MNNKGLTIRKSEKPYARRKFSAKSPADKEQLKKDADKATSQVKGRSKRREGVSQYSLIGAVAEVDPNAASRYRTYGRRKQRDSMAKRRVQFVKRKNLKNKKSNVRQQQQQQQQQQVPHHMQSTAASRGGRYGGKSPYTEPLPEFLTQVKERNHPIYGKLRY